MLPLQASGMPDFQASRCRPPILASDVLSLGCSEAVHVLGLDQPLNPAAARAVPHRASFEERGENLRRVAKLESV